MVYFDDSLSTDAEIHIAIVIVVFWVGERRVGRGVILIGKRVREQARVCGVV